MKKVLILGGTRFFGKVLLKKLIQGGHEVAVATRGNNIKEFEGQVESIILDRQNKESLSKALKGRKFDVVYDNICYSPDDARNLLEILDGNIGKYIVTSSGAVYDGAVWAKEGDFNPYNYPIKNGGRGDFTYEEGKRLVEAVVFREFRVPSIAVRFPVVIGEHDYTERLFFYVKNVAYEKEFDIATQDIKLSLITEEEAGAFLYALLDADFIGPINASSNGSITIGEILQQIEHKTHKQANVLCSKGAKDPYGFTQEYTLDTTAAKGLGFEFKEVNEEVEKVVNYYVQNI